MENKKQIIFKDQEGNVLTMEDLRNYSGQIDYDYCFDKPVVESARIYHKRGREFGQKGQYNEALEEFGKAKKSAPGWPHPLYDIAYIYLLAGEYEYALKFYTKTANATPRGFFTAKTAVHTLERERDEIYPAGMYASYLALEWAPDPQQKAQIVEQLTEKYPQFAPGWKELASMVSDDEERLKVIEKGLEAIGDDDTMGVLLVNKGLTLSALGKKEEAIEILGALAIDPNSTLVTEHYAKIALSQIMA